jgi:hypothetical protein
MARPLSEDKRTAILEAATELVAMLGVSAPTAERPTHSVNRHGTADGRPQSFGCRLGLDFSPAPAQSY